LRHIPPDADDARSADESSANAMASCDESSTNAMASCESGAPTMGSAHVRHERLASSSEASASCCSRRLVLRAREAYSRKTEHRHHCLRHSARQGGGGADAIGNVIGPRADTAESLTGNDDLDDTYVLSV
jgi:hypothetical protein